MVESKQTNELRKADTRYDAEIAQALQRTSLNPAEPQDNLNSLNWSFCDGLSGYGEVTTPSGVQDSGLRCQFLKHLTNKTYFLNLCTGADVKPSVSFIYELKDQPKQCHRPIFDNRANWGYDFFAPDYLKQKQAQAAYHREFADKKWCEPPEVEFKDFSAIPWIKIKNGKVISKRGALSNKIVVAIEDDQQCGHYMLGVVTHINGIDQQAKHCSQPEIGHCKPGLYGRRKLSDDELQEELDVLNANKKYPALEVQVDLNKCSDRTQLEEYTQTEANSCSDYDVSNFQSERTLITLTPCRLDGSSLVGNTSMVGAG